MATIGYSILVLEKDRRWNKTLKLDSIYLFQVGFVGGSVDSCVWVVRIVAACTSCNFGVLLLLIIICRSNVMIVGDIGRCIFVVSWIVCVGCSALFVVVVVVVMILSSAVGCGLYLCNLFLLVVGAALWLSLVVSFWDGAANF